MSFTNAVTTKYIPTPFISPNSIIQSFDPSILQSFFLYAMNVSELPGSSSVTIENCADEPIHLPGAVQPHGLLLVLDESSFTITQVSDNSQAMVGIDPDDLLGQPLSRVVGDEQQASIIAEARQSDLSPKNPFLKNINPLNLTIPIAGEAGLFNGIVHRSNRGLVLELERLAENEDLTFRHFYDLSRKSLLALQNTETLHDLYEVAAQEVRRLTGFDRVMIYRFDEQWNGDVVAEAKAKEVIDSFLGLHFPATDIPAQARALYLKNWLRFIPDVQYQPAKIITRNSSHSPPLDMSYGVLRSVSPIHLEYLQNMGVRATLTISLVKDNRLWGLIACHHLTPHYVPYQVRIASEYIGQILSLQLSLKQKSDQKLVDAEQRRIHSLLMETITRQKDYTKGFVIASAETLTLTNSRGAAVFHEGEMQLLGQTPTAEQVQALLTWLKDRLDEVNYLFCTNTLPREYEPATHYSDVAAGMLAIQVAKPQQSYILWFRPEVEQEVHWGGQPDKFVVHEEDGAYRLHPRKSFARWKEAVHQTALAWEGYHVEVAQALRNALKDVFVFKAEEYRQQKEELEQLNRKLQEEVVAREKAQKLLEMSNAELERFAYVASHDLQEPLRATANFTSLLKKRYEGELDERAQRYIHFIVDGTARMQTLINDILTYSRLQTKEKTLSDIDTNELLQEVKQNLLMTIKKNKAKITYDSLPTVRGDINQLSQVFQNLIGNSIKYHGEQSPEVRIQVEEKEHAWQFSISDNGIGIEPEYFDRIFIIFQRLHTGSEYEGTGVGLAICKRIVERHHGTIWLTSEFGQGSTFYFTISKHL